MCRLYLIGACDYGDRCRRTHITPDSPLLVLPGRESKSAQSEAAKADSTDSNDIPSLKSGQATAVLVEQGSTHVHVDGTEQEAPGLRVAEKSREDDYGTSKQVEAWVGRLCRFHAPIY